MFTKLGISKIEDQKLQTLQLKISVETFSVKYLLCKKRKKKNCHKGIHKYDMILIFWPCATKGIQFYLLLSSYLCFMSLLYLDLYVFGDDALIS